MTRREFPKTSGVAGSSVAMLGVNRAGAADAMAAARPNDPRSRLPDFSQAKLQCLRVFFWMICSTS